jgi:hypothetical protein
VFRRLFWLMIGAGFGFGVSFWLIRFVRETVERYTPERMSADIGAGLRNLGADIRAAVAEGRQAMAEQEARLRAEIGERHQRRGVGPGAIRDRYLPPEGTGADRG